MPSLIPDVVPKGSMAAVAQPSIGVGDALLLRPWQGSDVPAVVAAYADAQTRRWHLESRDEAEASAWIDGLARRWRAETNAGWAVTEAGSNAVLGRMELKGIHLDQGHAEVAYWVLPAARGRGVASAALAAMSRWAFDDLGLHRLALVHSEHNPASCAVATRSGFELEGLLRHFGLHDDGWHDYHLHARIRG